MGTIIFFGGLPARPVIDGSGPRRIDLGSLPSVFGRRLVMADTFELHLERLKLVMDRLQRAELKLNPRSASCCS